MPDYRRDIDGNDSTPYRSRSPRDVRARDARNRNQNGSREPRSPRSYRGESPRQGAYDRSAYGAGTARTEQERARRRDNPYARDRYAQGRRAPSGRSGAGRVVVDGRNTRSAANPADAPARNVGRTGQARRRDNASFDAVVTRGGAGERAGQGESGRVRRAPAARGNAQGSTGGFDGFARYLDNPQRRISPVMIAVPVLVLALVAFGIFQIVNPKTYDITINGAAHTVERGTTIDTVLEAGYAKPVAGDLLAVDGSLLEAGGGERFSAVVNGETVTTDGATPLKKKTTVEITDGADVTEPYRETTETIPFQQVEDENYWSGSLHVYIPGSDGVRATRTGDYSGITVTEDTTPVVHNQWKIYDANTGGDKVIALTFDDGPWAETTEDILDILDQYQAKATFFTVGYRIADHPDLIKRMQETGHQICTHSWDHAQGSGNSVDLTLMSKEEQIDEIEKGIQAIEEVTGTTASRVIRAPGGNFHGDIVWTLQSHITAEVGWDVDTQDWRRPGAEAIAEQILSAKAGNVILMHDGGGDRTQTVEALRIALPQLVEAGYTFVTVDELLAYDLPQSA